MRNKHTLLPALLVALAPSLSPAAPGVERILRKTPHFQLLIERSQADRLDSLGAWAESSWQKLSTWTGYRPDSPIRIVFHDEDDYANGWAMASNGWVNVWLTPRPFDLRGGSDWTRNVLAHELAHVFTLRALGKDGHLLYLGVGARTASEGFQGDLDIVARPNDLESWLVEGLAQTGAESCGNDSWDGHRDLLEHVAWKSSRTLPDGLLRTFWGDARESELVYNQGYSFLRWVLAEGKSDVAALLGDGRKHGLRSAIETSLGGKFPEIMERWRKSLASRHGEAFWPIEPGRTVSPPDRAATWVHESSAVGDHRGRIWLVSSRSNDFGRGSLWESAGDGLHRIVDDVHDRIRLSPDAKRVAFLRERSGVDRRAIRDLWIYRVDSRDMEKVTRGGRVQDADFHPEGFAVVARDRGANRVQIRDPRGAVLRSLPLHRGGDLVQVASDPSGRIVATSMGPDGFRLVASDDSLGWIPLDGVPTQARDPLWRDGRLWYSALDSGSWVAMSRDSVQARLEARFEGGAFAPFPLSADSLLVVRFEPQGLLAARVPAKADGKPRPRVAPAPPAPVSPPQARRARPIEGNATEVGSLVGYGFLLGVQQPKEKKGAVYRMGPRGFLQCGILAANSSMENTLEADVMIQATGPRQGSNLDAGLFIEARSEAWTPILDASYGSMKTSLEYVRGSDDALDNLWVGDTIPYLAATTYALGALLELSRKGSLETWFDHEDLAMGAHGTGPSLDAPLSSTDRWMGAASWSDFESGRHGLLSGWGVSLDGGRVWNWIASRNLIAPDYWLVEAKFRLAGHLSRRILFGTKWSGSLMVPDDHDPKALGSVEAEIGIPLGIPPVRIPLASHRGWTLVDPVLRLGHLTDIRPMSLVPSDDFRPAFRMQGMREGDDGRRIRPDLDEVRAASRRSSSRAPDVKVSQQAELELSWKTVTLWDFLARWSFGTSIPVSQATGWSELVWKASLSL